MQRGCFFVKAGRCVGGPPTCYTHGSEVGPQCKSDERSGLGVPVVGCNPVAFFETLAAEREEAS